MKRLKNLVIAGVLAAAIAAPYGCNRKLEDNSDAPRVSYVETEAEKYINERREITDELAEIIGDRLKNKADIFNSELENKDLENFVKLYKDSGRFRKERDWGEDYEEFNPHLKLGFKKLLEYDEAVSGWNLLPDGYVKDPENYQWNESDKTAVAQYMIMNGDVDLGTITF